MGATRHLLSNDINGLREQAGYRIGFVARLNSYNLFALRRSKTQPSICALQPIGEPCDVLDISFDVLNMNFDVLSAPYFFAPRPCFPYNNTTRITATAAANASSETTRRNRS
jgi:hypothetical protein